jgi:hypothetical protein
MNNVEINNIRDDSKSSLYYNDSEIENNIGSALSSVEHSFNNCVLESNRRTSAINILTSLR